MKIAIGTDHHGLDMKNFLKKNSSIVGKNIEWFDVGAFSKERSNYPVFAKKVVELINEKKVDYGVLICGSGIGMCIAANRFPGIYAGVCSNEQITRDARSDDNINVIVFPADYISNEQALKNLEIFLSTKFKEDSYAQRLKIIDES